MHTTVQLGAVALIAVAMAHTGRAAEDSATAQLVTLENALLRIQWRTESGAPVSLEDKTTGRQWLNPTVATPLYRIRLVDEKSPIASTAAKTVEVRKEQDAVVIECSHDAPAAMTVTCRFRLEEGTASVLGRIAVRSDAPCRIDEVCFPLVALGLPFAGSGEHDRLLLPICDGQVLCNPSEHSAFHQVRYPGSASLQLLAAFDPSAGVSLASRDCEAHTKTFCTRLVDKKALELSIAHLLPQTAVTEWELGYDVDLAALRPSPGLSEITWESAADLYRRWALEQPWCRQTMAQRVAAGDIPAWLVEPNLLLTFSLRGTMPDGSEGNRLPLLVEQVDRWSKMVGAPVTCLIISWEKLDTWTTPDYFPPFGGDEAFTAATEALHKRGHRTMVFLSGLHWTLRKEMGGAGRRQVSVDQQAEFDRRGRPWAISDAEGEAIISGAPDKGIGRTATICAGTPLAREILVDTSDRCQKLGIDCVQVDQIVGGGMKACFHPKHEHPPGGGTWCSEALYRIFDEIRRQGKARDPNFAFAIEEPGEFYLPLLDTYHARDLHQGRWPRSGAGVLGVPLFTHVYHDYLAGYGSEGCYASDRPSRLAMYQMGMNLVCGKIPAVALWGRWCEPEQVDPPQQRLLRAHIDLWRGPAGEFLNDGQRVAVPPLDVPSFDHTFREKNGTKRFLSLPTVLHSGWRLPDGREGTLFACVDDKPVEFISAGETIRLEPGEAAFRPHLHTISAP